MSQPQAPSNQVSSFLQTQLSTAAPLSYHTHTFSQGFQFSSGSHFSLSSQFFSHQPPSPSTLSLILRHSPTPWPRQTPSPVLAETTHSLSSCIFSWGPRIFPRPQPILDSPLQGCSAQPKDATAASTGEVQHQVCALREKHGRSPLLGKEEKCSL